MTTTTTLACGHEVEVEADGGEGVCPCILGLVVRRFRRRGENFWLDISITLPRIYFGQRMELTYGTIKGTRLGDGMVLWQPFRPVKGGDNEPMPSLGVAWEAMLTTELLKDKRVKAMIECD